VSSPWYRHEELEDAAEKRFGSARSLEEARHKLGSARKGLEKARAEYAALKELQGDLWKLYRARDEREALLEQWTLFVRTAEMTVLKLEAGTPSLYEGVL
jgi:hypothetical protein